jgi:hypothetical protein
MKASRIVLASVGCVAVLGTFLMKGPARESRAQVPSLKTASAEPEPAPLPAAEPKADVQELLEKTASAEPEPAPLPAAEPKADVQELPAAPASPVLPPMPVHPDNAGVPLIPSPEMLRVPGRILPPSGSPANDPEQVAREFVEKNQKIAETELAALKKEAEALQNRLRKVEAAIRRWEVVAHALKQSEGVVSKIDGSWKAEPSLNRVRLPNIDEPSDLEPIPQTKAIVDTVLP